MNSMISIPIDINGGLTCEKSLGLSQNVAIYRSLQSQNCLLKRRKIFASNVAPTPVNNEAS